MKLFAEGELYELLNAQLECMGVELLSQNLSARSPTGVDQYLASLLACYRSQPLVFDWEHAGFAKRDAPLGGDQDAAPTVTYRIPFAGTSDLLRYTARPLRWLRRHGTFVDADGYLERANLCFDLLRGAMIRLACSAKPNRYVHSSATKCRTSTTMSAITTMINYRERFTARFKNFMRACH